MRQSNESANESILRWLSRLSKHFNVELSDDQIEIFAHALRNNTRYQIDEAFNRCLNECQFMPKLADVHARMPEQKYPPENPGRFVQQEPILNLIRPIAEEICKGMTGREYHDLDTVKDAKQIEEVFAEANRTRYRRMGIDPERWFGRRASDAPRTA